MEATEITEFGNRLITLTTLLLGDIERESIFCRVGKNIDTKCSANTLGGSGPFAKQMTYINRILSLSMAFRHVCLKSG